jgi:uncharacterized membrane protein YdjX (TVP38/TMEM64 family)
MPWINEGLMSADKGCDDSEMNYQYTSNDSRMQTANVEAGQEDGTNATPAVPWWQLHRWTRASQMKLMVVVLIIVAITLFATHGKREWIEEFGVWSEQHKVEGAFALAGIYCIAAVFLIPAALLTIVAGFILGLPVGCCAVILGATLGSCLAFINARFLFRQWVNDYFISKYATIRALSHVIKQNQFKVVLLLRLSPIVPYNALNYCLGVMPLDFVPFIVSSFFGMMPGTLLYVYIGSTAASITDVATGNVKQTPLQQVLFWVGLGFTILLTICVTYLARRELKKQIDLSEEFQVSSQDPPHTHTHTHELPSVDAPVTLSVYPPGGGVSTRVDSVGG